MKVVKGWEGGGRILISGIGIDGGIAWIDKSKIVYGANIGNGEPGIYLFSCKEETYWQIVDPVCYVTKTFPHDSMNLEKIEGGRSYYSHFLAKLNVYSVDFHGKDKRLEKEEEIDPPRDIYEDPNRKIFKKCKPLPWK